MGRLYSKAKLTGRYEDLFNWRLRHTYFMEKRSELIFKQNDKGNFLGAGGVKKMILFVMDVYISLVSAVRGIYLFVYLPIGLLSSSPTYPVFLLQYSFLFSKQVLP